MDNIWNIILHIAISSLIAFFNLYCWNECLEIKIKDSRIKYTRIFILMNILTALLNYTLPKSIRLVAIFTYLIIINYWFITKNINKSIILVLISQFILIISEFLFILISSPLLGRNIYDFSESTSGFLILNIFITVISILIIKTGITKKIYLKIMRIFENINLNETFLYSSLIIFTITISTVESHIRLALPIVLATNIIMAIVFILIIFKFTYVKSNLDNINKKYQTSITSLKEYETMIDKFRVDTHENKNELLTIRNMIKSNDKKTVEYIDKLVDNKIKDNEKIMYQTSKIPEGGLRATIYSKLCVMDKYKIKYKLDTSKDVRTVDLINLDEELILNICKILGVFMDNAIEAVIKLRKKEINIELYVIDDELYIDITNNFKGEIDLYKIGHERHTTKGEEHGYGLLLVNKIISENRRNLDNEKSISGDYFTQTLKIRLK